MAAFTSPGNSVTQRIVFNSGTIDYGNQRIVELANVAIKTEWTTLGLYILGSIKPQDLVHHTQKVTATGKFKSLPIEVYAAVWGSSSGGSPSAIYTIDGNPSFQNPVITLFDRNGKEYQYQFVNAVTKSINANLQTEDFAEWDFEIEAQDIQALVYTP